MGVSALRSVAQLLPLASALTRMSCLVVMEMGSLKSVAQLLLLLLLLLVSALRHSRTTQMSCLVVMGMGSMKSVAQPLLLLLLLLRVMQHSRMTRASFLAVMRTLRSVG